MHIGWTDYIYERGLAEFARFWMLLFCFEKCVACWCATSFQMKLPNLSARGGNAGARGFFAGAVHIEL